MTDKEKSAKKASDEKRAPAEELRDLDVLDDKVKNVKGGLGRTIGRKRT